LRAAQKISLERLAHNSGIAVAKLRRLEAGVQPMTIDEAERLAWLLKVDALDLLD
jgi:transcriptional regulator with XRE-family HTH domain